MFVLLSFKSGAVQAYAAQTAADAPFSDMSALSSAACGASKSAVAGQTRHSEQEGASERCLWSRFGVVQDILLPDSDPKVFGTRRDVSPRQLKSSL